MESAYSIILIMKDKFKSAFHEILSYVTPYFICKLPKYPRKYVFWEEIAIVIVNLVRNKGYRSTLGIRNEVKVTIEVFTFLRKGITKMEA